MQRIRVIDSHTGGEPTRTVVDSNIHLGTGSLAERRSYFQQHADAYRRAMVCEPRGSEVIVGAMLTEPTDPACTAGVIFFNNVGYLGMCGHGMIGLVCTLAHLGRIDRGSHLIETPVGRVAVDFDGNHRVSLENIACFRHLAGVTLDVPGIGNVVGDVAWGGNWFFLVRTELMSLEPRNIPQLTDICWRIRKALVASGITGVDGAEIDHVELFSAPHDLKNHSRNFVLCPGGAYDRSPCGTGTSAKIACLAADGKLAPGETWRQESVIGSVMEGSYRIDGDALLPTIAGEAYITADATLLIDANDPLAWGIEG